MPYHPYHLCRIICIIYVVSSVSSMPSHPYHLYHPYHLCRIIRIIYAVSSLSSMPSHPYHLFRLIRIIYAVLDTEEELRARLADMEQAARVAGTHGKQRLGRDSKLLIGETLEIPVVLLLLSISQQHFLVHILVSYSASLHNLSIMFSCSPSL